MLIICVKYRNFQDTPSSGDSIPLTVVRHEMTKDELEAAFADGKYKRLPGEVYKRLEFHLASLEVVEHHVAVYAGMDNETAVYKLFIAYDHSYDLRYN